MDELKLYQQMMNKDPSSQAFIYLAEVLFEREMYDEAIETCINGLRLYPHHLRARTILGLSYMRTGELERAESELLKAKDMLKINTVIYQALGEILEKRGESDLAENFRRLFTLIHSSETVEPVPEGEREKTLQRPSLEAADVDVAPIEQEKKVAGPQADRILLSILEVWYKDVQGKNAQATRFEVPVTQGIDPERISAFVHRCMKRSLHSRH